MDTSLIQMNVRVNRELKQQAEEVLSRMGSSLTELVRLALETVARGGHDYERLMEVMAPAPATVRSERAEAFLADVSRISREHARFAEQYGLELPAFPALGQDGAHELSYLGLAEKVRHEEVADVR